MSLTSSLQEVVAAFLLAHVLDARLLGWTLCIHSRRYWESSVFFAGSRPIPASAEPAPSLQVSQLDDCNQPILSILVSLALIIPVVSVLLLLPSSLRLIALILKTGDVAEMEGVICPRDKMKVLLIAPGCQWQFGDNVIFPFFRCISVSSAFLGHTLICTECCAIVRPANTLQSNVKNVC